MRIQKVLAYGEKRIISIFRKEKSLAPNMECSECYMFENVDCSSCPNNNNIDNDVWGNGENEHYDDDE